MVCPRSLPSRHPASQSLSSAAPIPIQNYHALCRSSPLLLLSLFFFLYLWMYSPVLYCIGCLQVSVGTLLAFSVVNLSVLILRYVPPSRDLSDPGDCHPSAHGSSASLFLSANNSSLALSHSSSQPHSQSSALLINPATQYNNNSTGYSYKNSNSGSTGSRGGGSGTVRRLWPWQLAARGADVTGRACSHSGAEWVSGRHPGRWRRGGAHTRHWRCTEGQPW